MRQITLQVDKSYECDVLVCGGGVSGFAAAVSAARTGGKTILMESGGFLGGTATKGLVGPFMTCYDAQGKERIIKGLYSELEQTLLDLDGGIAPERCRGGDSYSGYRTKGHIGVLPFDVESLKIALEQMCLKAGVTLLYHTTMLDCATNEGNITEVYAANYNELVSIQAKMFIDTTGFLTLADGTVPEDILVDIASSKRAKQLIIDRKNEENLRAMTKGIVIPGKEIVNENEDDDREYKSQESDKI